MATITLGEHLALSSAERELLDLIADGLEDEEIAEATGLALADVQRRMSAFLTRVGGEDRFAVVWARTHRRCCVAGPGHNGDGGRAV
jgi:DNA-binding NarL/FixJ family response regulator